MSAQTTELPGIHDRYIVTAWNDDGQAYRYMALDSDDAARQVGIFADMGLVRASYRRVLWDNRTNTVI